MAKFVEDKKEQEARNYGRVIARGMEDAKVEREKNMTKAAKRHTTMLERAAQQALSGK